jgi:hypothetical protein
MPLLSPFPTSVAFLEYLSQLPSEAKELNPKVITKCLRSHTI